MKIYFTAILVLIMGVSTLSAQKFGYVNSQALLLSMQDIKTADDQLVAYQNELVTQGEQMVKKFESSYQTYLKEVNDGTLSKVQMQEKEATLAQEQQSIQAFEVEVQNLLATRKQSLYEPILQRVQEAVNKLGADEGYTFIFDTSGGGILFAVEAEDVTDKLKLALGI